MTEQHYFVREIPIFSPKETAEFLEAIKKFPTEQWCTGNLVSIKDGNYTTEETVRNHKTAELYSCGDYLSGRAKEMSQYLLSEAGSFFFREYDSLLKKDYPQFTFAHNPHTINPWLISKYNSSEYYDFHIDEGCDSPQLWNITENGKIKNVSKRTLSVVLYLNNDFEGGETCFAWGTKYKPSPGTAIVFPSSWPFVHSGSPVVSGTKYVAVAWISNLVPMLPH